MRIAIVHYHLDPGGVSSVIRSVVPVLSRAGIDHVILTGPGFEIENPESGLTHHRQVDGLGYLADPGTLTAADLCADLRRTATEALGGAPDLWHFHNPTLGKNRLFPELIEQLAIAGEALVLQIHDLAEHGRATHYPLIANRPRLYPFSPRIHYAFLNPRDREPFLQAGLPPENSSIIPNPVAGIAGSTIQAIPDTIRSPLLFAPIRGIRRKNLGELVLLAARVPAGTRIAVSRRPRNPGEQTRHDEWADFAAGLGLPIDFNVTGRLAPVPGAATTFESWVRHSTHYITSSVLEGFGLPAMEAGLNGKPLIGRRLPVFSNVPDRGLYDRLVIPSEFIDPDRLKSHLLASLASDHRAYGRPVPQTVVDTLLARYQREELDFGDLPEGFQRGIIAGEISSRMEVEIDGVREPAREWLARSLAQEPEIPAINLAVSYGDTLSALYNVLLNRPREPVHFLPPEEILTSCLRAENFHFLLATPQPPLKFRAAVFDIYGTLLIAPQGGVRPDPAADPLLREIITRHGSSPPDSPSLALYQAVIRHHRQSSAAFPEVDLRELWREILGLAAEVPLEPLVQAIEAAWHPATLMPGAVSLVHSLAAKGIPLCLISNGQWNSPGSLGEISGCFSEDLTILSFRHGIAKPSPELFRLMVERLAMRGISPEETLYVGNDPLQDIAPAAAFGFRTALFTGHPDSLRSGHCLPDFQVGSLGKLSNWF